MYIKMGKFKVQSHNSCKDRLQKTALKLAQFDSSKQCKNYLDKTHTELGEQILFI